MIFYAKYQNKSQSLFVTLKKAKIIKIIDNRPFICTHNSCISCFHGFQPPCRKPEPAQYRDTEHTTTITLTKTGRISVPDVDRYRYHFRTRYRSRTRLGQGTGIGRVPGFGTASNKTTGLGQIQYSSSAGLGY